MLRLGRGHFDDDAWGGWDPDMIATIRGTRKPTPDAASPDRRPRWREAYSSAYKLASAYFQMSRPP
jgi:hypothetical protein